MTSRTVSVDGTTIDTVAHITQTDGHWVELAYCPGFPEFTIVQVNLMGDWRLTNTQLQEILDYAVAKVCS